MVQSEHTEQSGTYCQQWTAIRGATCICDAVFREGFIDSVKIFFLCRYIKVSFSQYSSVVDWLGLGVIFYRRFGERPLLIVYDLETHKRRKILRCAGFL